MKLRFRTWFLCSKVTDILIHTAADRHSCGVFSVSAEINKYRTGFFGYYFHFHFFHKSSIVFVM